MGQRDHDSGVVQTSRMIPSDDIPVRPIPRTASAAVTSSESYGHLELLSLPVISPFCATFEESSVRRLPDQPGQSSLQDIRPAYDNRDRFDQCIDTEGRLLDNREQRYRHRQIPSQPMSSPSDFDLLASPLSIASSDAGKDYFKQPIGNRDPHSPDQSSEVHHTVGFEDDTGQSSSPGVSRSGTKLTGTGVGLGSAQSHRRVMRRNDSSGQQKKGWEKVCSVRWLSIAVYF